MTPFLFSMLSLFRSLYRRSMYIFPIPLHPLFMLTPYAPLSSSSYPPHQLPLVFPSTPPPPNNINTAHRGRFQVNVNPIGDSK